MLDVISPCVTFNDHEGSTKSYAYVKDHDDPLGEITFVPFFEDISVDYEPGTSTEVTMHDGSRVLLKKLDEKYDPTDKLAALTLLHETQATGRVRDRADLHRAGSADVPRPAEHRRHAAVDAGRERRAARARGAGAIMERLR